MTSGGKRKPAKAEQATGAERGRRVLMPVVSLPAHSHGERNSVVGVPAVAPCRRENWGGSLADVDSAWCFEPVTVSDAGSRCQGPAWLPSSTRLAPRNVPVGSCGRPALGIWSTPEETSAVEEVTRGAVELVGAGGRAGYRQGDAGGVRAGAARDQAGRAPHGMSPEGAKLFLMKGTERAGP
jgi:hypothetical protein